MKKKAKPAGKAKAPAKALHAKKPISLSYPKPNEMANRVRVEPPKIPMPSEQAETMPAQRMNAAAKKKSLPYKATAVAGALLIAGALLMFFIYVINLDWLFALCLAIPFFIGLSILFFEFLELSDRAAPQ